MKILVGYASAHGSTGEIAQEMAKVLEEYQYTATVADVTQVTSVDGYDGFVLGSPIHAGMWLTEMSQFLSRFGDQLAVKPIYFFITCIRVLEPQGMEHVIKDYVNHAVLNKLHVRETTAFAGKLTLGDIDWDERWTLAARFDGATPAATYNNDFREWDKIRVWSRHVADGFGR